MHCAPRKMQLLGVVSDDILPWKSILPGCGLAIAFTRAYVTPQFEQVVDNHPEVCQTNFVDDFAQLCIGTVSEVANTLALAAVRFVLMAMILNLVISDKSTCVATRPHISCTVAKALDNLRVKLLIKPDGARDLGYTLQLPGPIGPRSSSKGSKLRLCACIVPGHWPGWTAEPDG